MSDTATDTSGGIRHTESHQLAAANLMYGRKTKPIAKDVSTRTPDALQALCAEWQQRLRLMDWRVLVRVVPAYEMPTLEGECHCFDQTKEAVIRLSESIGKPQNTPIASLFPCDPERVLVHELLELHFDAFKAEKEGPTLTAQELAINILADALVALKRAASPEES